MKKSICLLLLAILLTPACNKNENEAAIDIDAEILKAMEAQNIPSVVAAIVKGDEISWEGNYGYADVRSMAPATSQSLYITMSVGKLVLATACMQLVEEGLIELDTDINAYLPFAVRNPGFPDQPVTTRMLLTHTSSLAKPYDNDRIPDFERFYTFEGVPLISEWLPEYIVPGGTYYREQVWKDYPPGAQEQYSNIGTSLLGLIIENVSGEDFRDYCRIHLFEPLEMFQTSYRLSEVDESLAVTPYDNQNRPIWLYTNRHYPAGFLLTNIEDFSHFAIAILNRGLYKSNRILQESTVAQMLQLQNPATGTAFLWGHCLGDCLGHNGGGTGFSTFAEWHPARDEAFFIFSNKVNESVYTGGRVYDLLRWKCGQE
jgi:CubicO group peptidase (beta-lactamase class C family)